VCSCNIRIDGTDQDYYRVVIASNGNTDVSNGLHAIDGNKGSTNYRSFTVSGNIEMAAGDYASTWIYQSSSGSYNIQGESGFSCHALPGAVGFRADMVSSVAGATGNAYKEIGDWRTSASNTGLYSVGGGFDAGSGRYTAPVSGTYYCSAQVRLDSFAGSYMRLLVALDGDTDVSNGMHSIIGNGASTNYQSLNVAGTMKIDAGHYVSTYVLAVGDDSTNIQHESGFGCHLLDTEIGFHADMDGDVAAGTGWTQISTWQTTNDPALYSVGGGMSSTGFTVPEDGYYFCASQVRFDASEGYMRLILAINGETDYNNGFHAIAGNGHATNYHTL
jgi:hypothetical protein